MSNGEPRRIQKVITVTKPFAERVDYPIVDEMSKDGWVVKQISTSVHMPTPESNTFPRSYIVATILFENPNIVD